MQGVVFLGDRKLEFMDFPDPKPGPDEVVLEIKASGMCGSDLKFYRSTGGASALGLGGDGSPVIAGHEPCGDVVEIGKSVDRRHAQVGQRVMVHHYKGCGVCSHCEDGWGQLCREGIVVYGATGLGKTHLLQGAALRALSDQQSSMYIDCCNALPEHVLESIEQLNWISIDNVDAIHDNQHDLVFDLYNRAKQAKVTMLVSGSDLPSELDVMKDLKTRLGLASIFQLQPLDDELTMSVLNNQMIDRNLSIDSKVYEYLFKYYSRDVKILLAAMDDLDKASLQAKQSITIPFVKKILNV